MNVFELLDIALPQLSSTSAADASSMSVGGDVSTTWKLWFPDESSSVDDGCSFADDYDIGNASSSRSADRRGGTAPESSTMTDNYNAAFSGGSQTPTTTTKMKPTAAGRLVYACAVCARAFISEKYLSMHAALHRKSSSTQAVLLPAVGSTATPTPTTQLLAASPRTAAASSASPLTTRTKWTCEVCFKSFAQNSNYKNHIRTHSDERPFVCHVCSIGFKERYHLKKHTLFKHTGELNEACRQCGKRFKDSTAVRAHERIHSELRPYSCVRCGKAFKTSECLWHHDHRSKTCGRTKHLTCTLATASHVSNNALKAPAAASRTAKTTSTSLMPTQQLTGTPAASVVHLQPQSSPAYTALTHTFNSARHSTPLPHNFGSTAGQNGGIKQEQNMSLTVSSAPPTSCYFQPFQLAASTATTAPRVGDIRLPSSGGRSVGDVTAGLFHWTHHQPPTNKPVAIVVGQHIMTSSTCVTMTTTTTGNSNKQRAVCSRCGKQFASALAFERHLAVHSETRPYRCQLCDVGFKLKVHLKKHNLYRHNADYPCRCGVCGKPFKDSSAVRLHERIHSTARPFQCACGKSFKTRENLWGHRHRRPCAGFEPLVGTASRGAACRDVGTVTSFPVGTETRDNNNGQPTTTSSINSTTVTADFGGAAATTNYAARVQQHHVALRDDISMTLPPFETLIPVVHHRDQTPISYAAKFHTAVGGLAFPVTSLNDVIVRSSNMSPMTATVKLPNIEQLFDRTASWQQSQCNNIMTSDVEATRCVPVACWDVDALWFDHKMAVTN